MLRATQALSRILKPASLFIHIVQNVGQLMPSAAKTAQTEYGTQIFC